MVSVSSILSLTRVYALSVCCDDAYSHKIHKIFLLPTSLACCIHSFLTYRLLVIIPSQVGNVPSNAEPSTLKEAFTGYGDVKGILSRFQAEHGIIILAFFDVRDAIRAQRFLSTASLEVFGGRALSAKFISASVLEKVSMI
jgi:hypothetical protein